MKTSKRIYIGLLGLSLFLVMLVIILGYYLVAHRYLFVNKILLIAVIIFMAGAVLVFSFGIIALIFMIKQSRNMPALDHLVRLVNEVLFPLTLVTGKIFGIKRERILKSFIEVNNHIVGLKRLIINNDQILLLLPHCLQNSQCSHKITMDINNCRSCGQCKIGEIKKIAEDNNIILKIATGGTMARKYISENRPRGVIAVACERDLSSGIQDSGMIPVVGVLNCFTKGPCVDTDVDLNVLESALLTFNKGG
ncbi:MAG: DUF116 domain-containing protein [Syntrophomonadaceae bacterium]|jgi:hypothetical protein|nr:DUF116 domain-containing protein [Syntrophomonadaceae bacterium]